MTSGSACSQQFLARIRAARLLLSVTYGDQGIRVSRICPMGANTDIHNNPLASDDEASQLGANVVAKAGNVLDPEDVAAITLAPIEEETLLVLPHPEVLDYYRRKGSDYDRWLDGMRLQHGVVRD